MLQIEKKNHIISRKIFKLYLLEIKNQIPLSPKAQFYADAAGVQASQSKIRLLLAQLQSVEEFWTLCSILY